MNENEYQFLLESFLNKVRSYEEKPGTIKKQSYPELDTQKKIENVITELYHRVNDRRGAEISFDKKG